MFPSEASRWQQQTALRLVGCWQEKKERATREGRGADTSSCGTIALQRRCDTFPTFSLRTTELPLDRKGGRDGGGGVLCCHRWTALNVSIHTQPQQPSTHTDDVPASSYLPADILFPYIYLFIRFLQKPRHH